MNRQLTASIVALSLTLLVLTAGCGKKKPADSASSKGGNTQAKVDNHGHDHAHECEEGPRGGQLVELAGKYHAELVADEKTHMVTVHLLDAKARDAVAIDQPELVINAVVKGTPTQHRLKAASQGADKASGASRFELADEDLFDALFERDDAKGRLTVEIDGKPYSGEIKPCHHGHDHDHDHKHKTK